MDLSIKNGLVYGHGSGRGSGYGSGNGSGNDSDDGSVDGLGNGLGNGSGYGSGNGSGTYKYRKHLELTKKINQIKLRSSKLGKLIWTK